MMDTFADIDRYNAANREWLSWAIGRIDTDAARTCETNLRLLHIPGAPKVDVYLKDESTHPTGSLKHRLARSLFLYALCNGNISPRTTIVEASSGSTAVSEAYFARLLRLPFVAVMPRTTSPAKVEHIEREGGRCHFVESAGEVYAVATRLADELGGHYIDQFTNAERATDWRGTNNIAESIFEQLSREEHPDPEWIVVSPGTGGTSTTIGRFIRYRQHRTKLCVTDPERSVFFQSWCDNDREATGTASSRIEGIGRPRIEPSFLFDVVDRMMRIPDAGSIAAMRFMHQITGRPYGPSTGTNIYGVLRLACEMSTNVQPGSIVSLICDEGTRYDSTYYNDGWISDRGFDLAPHTERIERAYRTGAWSALD